MCVSERERDKKNCQTLSREKKNCQTKILRAAVTGNHTFELIVEIDVLSQIDFCWMVSGARIEDILDDARRGLEVEDDFVFALRRMTGKLLLRSQVESQHEKGKWNQHDDVDSIVLILVA